MTQFLPENLLALFAPRPPIQYKPPPDDLFVNRRHMSIDGVAEFVDGFEDPKDTPPKPKIETREEKRLCKRKEKQELLAYKIEQGIATWAPAENKKATTDPYKTLFVARINYETSESKLRREFEKYGKVKKVVMVYDKNSKPRGYAFVEYEHKSDMSEPDELPSKSAYKKADGAKIDGRRVVADYERGRTKKSWLPRRLGGGKGDTRRTRESKAALAAREFEESVNGGGRHSRERSERSSRRSRSRDRDRDRRSRSRDRERDRRR